MELEIVRCAKLYLCDDIAAICISYLRHLVITLNSDSNICSEKSYVNNVLEGTETQYLGRRINSISNWLNGARHGPEIVMRKDGSIEKKCTYYHSALDGEYEVYDDDNDDSDRKLVTYAVFDKGVIIEYSHNYYIKESYKMVYGESVRYEYKDTYKTVHHIDGYHGYHAVYDIHGATISSYNFTVTWKWGAINRQPLTLHMNYFPNCSISGWTEKIIGNCNMYKHPYLICCSYNEDGELHGQYKKIHAGTNKTVCICNYNNGKLHGNYMEYRHYVGNNDVYVTEDLNYKDGLLHGRCLYKNGEHNAPYIHNYKDGLLHGESIRFYSEGIVECVTTYDCGNKHGKYTHYNKDGNIDHTAEFVDDVLYDGTYIEYTAYMINHSVIIAKNGMIIREEKWYGEHLFSLCENDQLWNLYITDSLITVEQKGYIYSYVTIYDHNKVIERYRKLNGLHDGKCISYYENGNIKCVVNYKLGQMEGSYYRYYDNGEIYMVYECHEGDICGDVYIQSNVGVMLFRGFVNNGYIYGSWESDKTSYDSRTGKLTIYEPSIREISINTSSVFTFMFEI